MVVDSADRLKKQTIDPISNSSIVKSSLKIMKWSAVPMFWRQQSSCNLHYCHFTDICRQNRAHRHSSCFQMMAARPLYFTISTVCVARRASRLPYRRKQPMALTEEHSFHSPRPPATQLTINPPSHHTDSCSVCQSHQSHQGCMACPLVVCLQLCSPAQRPHD